MCLALVVSEGKRLVNSPQFLVPLKRLIKLVLQRVGPRLPLVLAPDVFLAAEGRVIVLLDQGFVLCLDPVHLRVAADHRPVILDHNAITRPDALNLFLLLCVELLQLATISLPPRPSQLTADFG